MHLMARVVVVASFAVAACGGSNPNAPSAQTLAGTWKATRAEFANASNLSQKVEIVALGTTLTLTLDAGGTYSQKITDPGQGGQTTTGTWSSSKDVLTLKPTGISGNTQFDMSMSGSTLTLNGGHVLFDVNLDGRDEEAILNVTLTRQ